MDGGPADLGAKLVMARERRDTTTGLRDAFILYDKSTDCYHLAVYLISRCSPPSPPLPRIPSCLIFLFTLHTLLYRLDRRHIPGTCTYPRAQPSIANTWSIQLRATLALRCWQRARLADHPSASTSISSHFHIHSGPPSLLPPAIPHCSSLSVGSPESSPVCLTASCRQHALHVFTTERQFSQSSASSKSTLHRCAARCRHKDPWMHAPMFPRRNRLSDAKPMGDRLTILM